MRWMRCLGKRRASLLNTLLVLLIGLAFCGCSTFRERPGHSGLFGPKPAEKKPARTQTEKKMSSWWPFQDTRPRPSKSIDDFLSQDRVDW